MAILLLVTAGAGLLFAHNCAPVLKSLWRPPSLRPSRGDLIQPDLWEDPDPHSPESDTLLVAPEILASRYEVIRRGASGSRVSLIQIFLKRAGLYSGEITGYYDEQTEAAVKKFQSAFGLRPDGRVGWKTAEAMRKVMRGEVR